MKEIPKKGKKLKGFFKLLAGATFFLALVSEKALAISSKINVVLIVTLRHCPEFNNHSSV